LPYRANRGRTAPAPGPWFLLDDFDAFDVGLHAEQRAIVERDAFSDELVAVLVLDRTGKDVERAVDLALLDRLGGRLDVGRHGVVVGGDEHGAVLDAFPRLGRS